MSKRIAINGFGRIGRLTFRNLLEKNDLEVVAINDLTDNGTLAHLLKYDSAHGKFDGTVSHTEDSLIVNGNKIFASAERNPENLPWKELKVDVVLECTGIFRSAEQAGKHVTAGAKKIIISAPGKGDGISTVVLGVNDDQGISEENVCYSNASCTTNCMAPVVDIIVRNWGLVQGSMTTIHAYTADQNIQDGPHSDLRRARAAAFNIVPTSTGAAAAVSKVIPEVAGKISAMAVRVPTITGSMIELNCLIEKETSAEEVNRTFQSESEGRYNGIIEFCTDPIVSSDIVGNKHSSIFDSLITSVDGKWLKVVSWYDNEAGYSARLADLVAEV